MVQNAIPRYHVPLGVIYIYFVSLTTFLVAPPISLQRQMASRMITEGRTWNCMERNDQCRHLHTGIEEDHEYFALKFSSNQVTFLRLEPPRFVAMGA